MPRSKDQKDVRSFIKRWATFQLRHCVPGVDGELVAGASELRIPPIGRREESLRSAIPFNRFSTTFGNFVIVTNMDGDLMITCIN